MKLKPLLIFIFIILPLLTFSQSVVDWDKIDDAVVLIEIENFNGGMGHGSGFFIEESGIIVTNYHVIEGAKTLRITTEESRKSNTTYETELILRGDKSIDLAIIRIENPSGKKFPFLTIEDSLPTKGSECWAIGTPFETTFMNTISKGLISNIIYEAENNRNLIQVNAPFTSGSSGGALLNNKGKIVGVTSGGWVGENAARAMLNFAIWTGNLKDLPEINQKHVKSDERELADASIGFVLDDYSQKEVFVFINGRLVGKAFCKNLSENADCNDDRILKARLEAGKHIVGITHAGSNIITQRRISVYEGECTVYYISLNLNNQLGVSQKERTKKTDTEIAENSIKKLKNTALIVRLRTQENLINALEEKGDFNRASIVREQQRKKNEEIIMGFKTHFDFCPTYFVLSNQTESIKSGRWEEVVFLNENALPDSSLTFPHCGFLTSEFTTLPQDISALVITDDKFEPISLPFPYYVNSYSELLDNRKAWKSVTKLNGHLHAYFHTVNK